MYEDFFGLKTLPFKITPDPSFIYWDAAHKRAASILAFGIEQLVPITVVTGEVGTGKTTLLRHFLDEAPRETTVGMLSNFWSGMGGLYQWILNAFDLHAEGTPVQLYRVFEDFVISEYAAGRRCVLIVDEAQNVSDEDLEQLRMLTNINAHKDCLLMLFLVGQPELRDRLQQPKNRQIAQRVGAAFHLGPMTQEATGHYIRHRIAVAGGTKEIFEDSAIERIYEASTGIPRLVNVICELALVTAFGDGIQRIDGAFMDEFLAEAGETGLIAHLPFTPATSSGATGGQPAKPVQPGGSGGAQVRKSAGIGNRKPSIRLVSDPWDVDAPDVADPLTKPAARSAEPESETEEQVDAPEIDANAILSPEPIELEEAAKAEPSERSDINPDPDDSVSEAENSASDALSIDLDQTAEIQTDSTNQPIEAPRKGRVPRMLSGAFNIALIGLGIAGIFVFATKLSDDQDTSSSEVPASNTETAETVTPQSDVVSADIAEAVAPAVTAAQQPETPSEMTATSAESDPSQGAELLDDPDGAALLEGALSSGLSDPVGSAIAYSRAALRGQDRAAYYLGQLFETGVGVPLDVAASRAWYEKAQNTVRSARRRLSEIGTADLGEPLAPPTPLLGGLLPNGSAEFVWSAGKGGDPEFYVVETALDPQDVPDRIGPVRLTAVADASPLPSRIWRVLAIQPGEGAFSVSDWRQMGAQGELLSQQPEPLISPRIILLGSDPALAGVMQTTLESAGMKASFTEREAVAESSRQITYAYGNDQAFAESVADLLGDDFEVTRISAGSSADDLVLPGQVFVRYD